MVFAFFCFVPTRYSCRREIYFHLLCFICISFSISSGFFFGPRNEEQKKNAMGSKKKKKQFLHLSNAIWLNLSQIWCLVEFLRNCFGFDFTIFFILKYWWSGIDCKSDYVQNMMFDFMKNCFGKKKREENPGCRRRPTLFNEYQIDMHMCVYVCYDLTFILLLKQITNET